MDTEAKIRAAVSMIMGDRELTENTHFINDLGADSLDLVELVLAIEDEFGIELSDDDAESINTFGDAVRLVTKRLAED